LFAPNLYTFKLHCISLPQNLTYDTIIYDFTDFVTI